jgi:O-antigen ligase
MLAELRSCRFPVETALLVALCFFLPLFEAPKNLAWLLFVAVWLANRARARDFGGRWDRWDSLFAAWIASGYLVAAFAGLHKSEWGGVNDLLRYASIGWLVKRGGYSERELRWVLGALVVSAVAGLAWGFWRMSSGAGKSGTLQLHSVGHVNHTAVYLAIMLGVCASWIFARWRSWRAGRRATSLAVGALLLVALMVTASRGAIGVGLGLVLVLAALWWRRWRAPLIAGVAAIALTLALAVGLGVEVVRKQQTNAAAGNVLAFRDGVWRMGLAAWERYPWFGVGMDNYSLITHELVRTWRTAAGKDYSEASYVRFPHGHSLFVNTLAERGAVGFAALAAVLLAWLVALWRKRPARGDGDFHWLAWGAAAGAWIATVAIGTVNTTLHHEHGILAVLLLGLWLSTLRPRSAS